ncbi:MAG TPA: hydantoinase B/oxoprolinase family protein, partial [Burkholderiales bacterium]|nr:hydantoinase B/oxoprolinase family protein [Burkholderiales bacterium]
MTESARVDPVVLEIVRNALTAIADRITTRMIRSANSFIVKEMEDCSAALFDPAGQLLAESANIPIHLNCVGVCLRSVLDHHFPAESWKPGDVVITNDPYLAGTSLGSAHTNDYIAFAPVFWEERLAGIAGLMVHHMDIGAMHMGTRGWGTEIWQEGLRIPPLKVIDAGRMDANVLAIILNNTRVPETIENDLLSQLSSVQAAREELTALFRKYGAPVMEQCAAALIAYSERRMRDEIARIPDGEYTHAEPILDDGAQGGPYWLRLKLIKLGSDITFDFTGTDPQIKGPINCPLGTTWAALSYAMRCVTDPSIPSTEGCKRPLKVIAPAGTLVNAQKPAAVYQRMVVCHSMVDLVMGALADALPDRVMGDSCGCMYNYTMAIDDRSGRRIMFGEVVPGGMGATASADGIDVMSCHVTNCPLPPVECTEIESPVLYLRRELRTDTGGVGRWRGGVGQVLTYRVLGSDPQLHHTSQKSCSLPQGMHGGKPGDGGRWVVNEGLPGERVLEHAIGEIEQLAAGDTVTHYTPGGGGYG